MRGTSPAGAITACGFFNVLSTKATILHCGKCSNLRGRQKGMPPRRGDTTYASLSTKMGNELLKLN